MAPDEHRVQVRWPDLDGLGHVNHSAVLVYLEVGRDAVLTGLEISPADYVVRHCVIDYRAELRPRGAYVRYQCTSRTAGTTSITLTETLLDDDGVVAVQATFTLVLWDGQTHAARALTERERTNLTGPRSESTEESR